MIEEKEDGYFEVKTERGNYLCRIQREKDGYRFSCSCQDFTYRASKENDLCKHGYGLIIADTMNTIQIHQADSPEKAKEHVRKMTEDQELILKVDDMDEELAIKETIEGVEPLVYTIQTKEGTKHVLSIRGWIQAMMIQGNIKVDVEFEEVGGKIIAKATGVDTKHNVSISAIAERYTRDEFKFTTLASKAVRNALKKLVLPAIEQKVIEEALTAKRVIILEQVE